MKKLKRLHSEDARFLRTMLYDILRRLDEVESAVGHLQVIVQPDKVVAIPEPEATEVISL